MQVIKKRAGSAYNIRDKVLERGRTVNSKERSAGGKRRGGRTGTHAVGGPKKDPLALGKLPRALGYKEKKTLRRFRGLTARCVDASDLPKRGRKGTTTGCFQQRKKKNCAGNSSVE